MALSKDQILAAASGFRREEVEVPEWGGSVWVREMAAAERDQWEGTMVSRQGAERFKNLRALVVCLTVCDADGKRLFTDGEIEQVGRRGYRYHQSDRVLRFRPDGEDVRHHRLARHH